ncbi:hypothetical protein LTR70_006404 [Exophiala xenobiotica]|uniref:MaoC-like domain-containing protein n=1 Tax=Lithohypha guttulata TaxID=1690604 RepID=A0ABR0K3K2_9EURO|nr:hypothetical protein LTR24_007395 [Lithohypha guttulata]KAK5316236.1 hypothetical protein LTR70_006404 [Exophiala xenobiotica]
MAFLLPSSLLDSLVGTGRLYPLRSGNVDDASLDFFPQELAISEVILVILIFFGRQILHLIGIKDRFYIRSGPSKDEESYELPELMLAMPFRLNEEDLKKYTAALNTGTSFSGVNSSGGSYQSSENLLDSPAQTCLVLSAFSEPAMLLLLAHHRSPIRPLGAVNVRNRFEVLRPDLCSAEMLMNTKLVVVAALKQQTRKVKRGLEIDIAVEIASYVDPDVVVFRQVFTMLQFMKLRTGSVLSAPKADGLSIGELSKREGWRSLTVSAKASRRWAKVCKDYNPIHISRMAAKIFGFSSSIAHGNHALALALAQFDMNHDYKFDVKDRPFTMEVQFRKPIVLSVILGALAVQEQDNNCDIYLEQNAKVCASLEELV